MTLKSLEVNNKELTNVLISDDYTYGTSEVVLDVEEIEGRDRKIVKNVNVVGVEESIPIVYVNTFNEELKSYEEVVDELVKELKFGKEEVSVSFKGGKYYRRGYFKGVIELEPIKDIQYTYSLELTFEMTDAYRYTKKERAIEFSGGTTSVGIENYGEDVEPIIELEALKDVQYVAIRNMNTEDVFVLGENIRSSVERTDTLKINKGSNRTNKTGKLKVILEDGKLKPNTEVGESVTKYTSGEELQDFMVEIKLNSFENKFGVENLSYVSLRDSKDEEFVKVTSGIGTREAGDSLIGKDRIYIEIKNSNGTMSRVLEVRSVGLEDLSWNVRLERIGRVMYFKVWKVEESTGKTKENQYAILDDSVDRNFNFDVLMKSVDVGFLEYQNIVSSDIFIDKLDVYKIDNGERRTYKNIKKGNKIVINNRDRRVTMGNEPMGNLKEAQSKYIKLKTGVNNLQVIPYDAFKGKVIFRERKI